MSGSLTPAINCEFNALAQRDRVLVEYVWIGGTGRDLRSKTKVVDFTPNKPEDLPVWNYDGSSTGQAPGHDSEVLIKPVALFKDPFRGGDNLLALCATYTPSQEDGSMLPLTVTADLAAAAGVTGNNTRDAAVEVFSDPAVAAQECWYGIEQEYTLYHQDKVTPLGFPKNGYPAPQGQYYCSAGVDNAFGRDVAEAHLRACLHAGVKVSGINAEVMPGQWEYQVGPCTGIEAGDHLTMSRYLMLRVCEKYGVVVTFEPKPMKGDWNGAGCHTNFSTKDFRNPKLKYEYTPATGPYAGKPLTGAFAKMIEALDKMGAKAAEHIAVYGADNDQRLTGKHETADMNTWSYGVANRGASVRIPRQTYHQGYGYLEDRRPASNMDPYVVTSLIARSILL
jgi:glutamine synthetase